MTNDLLRTTLTAVAELAEAYLQNVDRRGESWLALTSLVARDGTPNPHAADKIVMAVHNLTRETALHYAPSFNLGDAAPPLLSAPLYLNVQLVFVANFAPGNYADGLAGLSRLIGFFQQTPTFTHDNALALGDGIDSISMDFETLDTADVHRVTGMLGARYLPSAFYRLRTLPFVSMPIQSRGYPGA